MRKLNLGCGYNKKDGWINIDNDETVNPDIVRDLTRGLPFDDNSFDTVICTHTIEHVLNIAKAVAIELTVGRESVVHELLHHQF